MELDFEGDEDKIRLNDSGIMFGTCLLEIPQVIIYISLLTSCIHPFPPD